MNLNGFVAESNRIESIGYVTAADIDAHKKLLALDELTIPALIEFVHVVAGAKLRRDNVRVGNHVAPYGGPHIVHTLRSLLAEINALKLTPYAAHVEYETLHPWGDGNGRSGRAVWAWHMLKLGQNPFELGFLHSWYYQSLEASR